MRLFAGLSDGQGIETLHLRIKVEEQERLGTATVPDLDRPVGGTGHEDLGTERVPLNVADGQVVGHERLEVPRQRFV